MSIQPIVKRSDKPFANTGSPNHLRSRNPTNTNIKPTAEPSFEFSESPTLISNDEVLSMQPTTENLIDQIEQPTLEPTTEESSELPTIHLSNQHTKLPSVKPVSISKSPTNQPSHSPTERPTRKPRQTQHPSVFPSKYPSFQPSKIPHQSPTGKPTQNPSQSPSNMPTVTILKTLPAEQIDYGDDDSEYDDDIEISNTTVIQSVSLQTNTKSSSLRKWLGQMVDTLLHPFRKYSVVLPSEDDDRNENITNIV